MAPRQRLLAFGTAGVLVVAGLLCALLVSGLAGELLTTVLLSLGLAGAVLLVFLEVGLSEDRELARQQQEQRASPPPRKRPRQLPPRRLNRARRRPQ